MSVEANKLIVEQFHDAMARGDGAGALALLAPDALWWMPSDEIGGVTRTRDDMVAVFTLFGGMYREPPRMELVSLTAEGDRVALEKSARGGETFGGARYDNDYFMLFRLRDGLIVEVREYFDPRQVEPLVAELQNGAA